MKSFTTAEVIILLPLLALIGALAELFKPKPQQPAASGQHLILPRSATYDWDSPEEVRALARLARDISAMDDLRHMSRPCLKGLAQSMGLSTDGSNRELRERLADARIDALNNPGPESLTAAERNAGGLL